MADGTVPLVNRERDEARPPSTPVLGSLDADNVTPRRLGRPWPDPRIPEQRVIHAAAAAER